MSFFLWVCLLSTGDREVDEVAVGLESSAAATRRVAVRELGEIGTPQAFDLILPCLADKDGEVADEAQWQLANSGSPLPFLGRSGLRSPDPWVRLRAAELLGRMSCPVDARALSRHLSRKERDQSAALVWSLERLARRGMLAGDLVRCAKDVARAVRFGGHAGAAALLCLEALDARELEVELVRASRRSDELQRSAAAEASARRSGSEDWVLIEALSCDEDSGVRRVLVKSLAFKPSLRKVHLLIERLEREDVRSVREEIVALLRAWSGLRHRFDPRPWADWARTLAPEWRASAQRGRSGVEGATASFAGVPISSERLCVLVDLSGSIQAQMSEGVTRRDYVESELAALLKELSASARFNLIAFCDKPYSWKSELELNRRGTAAEALKWFLRLSVRGRGDLFSAAMQALNDPEVDTLLIFTDGVPTGGRRWKLCLMASLLEQECRFRGVSIDSALVGASARTVAAWEGLSSLTGGRSVQVKLE